MSIKAPPLSRGQSGPLGSVATTRADQLVPVLLLNVQDVATLLGIGTRTVWRLAGCGEIPAPIAIGGRRLWHRPTLEAFISEKAAAIAAVAEVGRRR